MEIIMFTIITLIIIVIAIYRNSINKPILNFRYNNLKYLIFKNQDTISLGKYENNKFEIIFEDEKQSLKNIINILLSDNINGEEFNNLEILNNQNIPNTNKIKNTIKLEMNNDKKEILKNNCKKLNDFQKINNDNQNNFTNYMTRYIISTITIPIIIFIIGFFIIEITIITTGIFGSLTANGKILLLIGGGHIFTIIYEIVSIVKIIEKFIKHYNKAKTIISFLIIQTLLFIILNYSQMFINPTIKYNNILEIISLILLFKIPLAIFISSLIIIYDLRKNDKTDNPKKTSLRIKIIISILAILTISLIIYRIVITNKYYEQSQQKPQPLNPQQPTEKIDNSYCTTYIAETDSYVYCETNIGQIKQINLITKEKKIYGDGINDIPLYDANTINNKNYIYYLDYNANNLDNLYVIDIIKGTQTKIGSYDIDLMNTYKSIEEKLYYTIIDYPNYTKITYMYDPITNKNTKLNDDVDTIKYVNNNKIYHSIYDKMYIYDNENYTDRLLYENYNENLYEQDLNNYILDKNNGMQYLINDGTFTISNITNNIVYFEDNSREYTSFIINDNKLYISYSKDYDNSIISIDLNDSNYNITEINVDFYPTNVYIVHNNYLYYAKDQIYKINLSNGESEKIYNNTIHNIQKGNSDYIYMRTTNNEFIRLNTNTDQYEIIDKEN